MAMNVTLRSRNGADVYAEDLGNLNAFPDIIKYKGASYVLKRVMPDKQYAIYYEANEMELAGSAAQTTGGT